MKSSRVWTAVAAFALWWATVTGAYAAQDRTEPKLRSSAVLVMDQETGEVLLSQNSEKALPIASLTKLMTALITLEAGLDLDEQIAITEEDIDTLKGTSSRLRVGSRFSRDDLLKLALMASENRAASALGRSFPGGKGAFVAAMNAKARELGMHSTHFVEPTGLSSANVSSAEDLAKLVRAAHELPLIREYSTMPQYQVKIKGRPATFVNTNALVRSGQWDIGLSKTGYISEAGRCLVMQAKFNARPVIIVLLDSFGKYTRVADAKRIRAWLDPDFRLNSERVVASKPAKAKTAKKVATKKKRVRTQVKRAAR
ncbi:MAG: D-alanyl-D-alanine endopeptidase [Pseudomonadota bacterium]|nr:MAG: D-alanyl-D-alanine endopeptidase [Pseudomonadota bacterium]